MDGMKGPRRLGALALLATRALDRGRYVSPSHALRRLSPVIITRGAVLLVLVVTLAGCSLRAREKLLYADDVAATLQSATGMSLRASPPIGKPDPQVAATLVGGDESESVTVLVFFNLKDALQPLGQLHRNRVAGVNIIRRANVVVLYTRRPGSPDHLGAIRKAINTLALKD
jgi:hypothetical protein